MAKDACTIVHVLYSFATGGMENIVATIIREASPGFRHILVCLTESGDSTRHLPPGIDIIELHKPPGNSLRFFRRLSYCLKKLQPDIVQSYNWSGIDAIIAARLAGLKNVIQSEHGWDMDDPDGLNPKRLRIRRFLSRWTSAFTCVSRQMATWLREDVRVHSPVFHIYNGVNTNIFHPGSDRNIRQKLAIPDTSFVLGIVSRLDPIKDHALLLRVFARLQKNHPETILLVVGDGPEKQRLRELSGANVFFLGNRPDVPDILRALDVFVLPSFNEGISCAITEAMASALPVVATKVGGNPELVDHNKTGFLFPVGDEERLLELLQRYILDPQLARQHGKVGRKKILISFSNENMVEAYEHLYQTVLGTNRI